MPRPRRSISIVGTPTDRSDQVLRGPLTQRHGLSNPNPGLGLEPYNDGIDYGLGDGQPRGGDIGQDTNSKYFTDAPPKYPEWKPWYNIFPGKWKSELAKWQAEYNYWQWKEEIQQQSPKNQVAGYLEAGLSPALMYGQGTSGNVSNNSSAPEGSIDIMNPFQMISAVLDLKKQVAETKKTEQETENINYKSGLQFAQTQLTQSQYKELTDKLAVQNMPLSELIKVFSAGRAGVREASVLANYGKDMGDADNIKLRNSYQEQMNQWLTANNMSKWIPFFTSLLRVAF